MPKRFDPRLDILPDAQRELWPQLSAAPRLSFVLYGGTAVALHLGHRQSVDFDFFPVRSTRQGRTRQGVRLYSHRRGSSGCSRYFGRLGAYAVRSGQSFVLRRHPGYSQRRQCPGSTVTFGAVGRLVFDTTSEGTSLNSTVQLCRARSRKRCSVNVLKKCIGIISGALSACSTSIMPSRSSVMLPSTGTMTTSTRPISLSCCWLRV